MSYNCDACEENKNIGHNYCRTCGYHITKGQTQNRKQLITYFTNEKYCGFCGGQKYKCKCTQTQDSK